MNPRMSYPLIFENCIKKNFHVPNMKSGPREERGCNFDPNKMIFKKKTRAYGGYLGNTGEEGRSKLR